MTDLSEKEENMKEFDAETVQERLKTVENHKACGQNLQKFRLRRSTGTIPGHRPPRSPPTPSYIRDSKSDFDLG